MNKSLLKTLGSSLKITLPVMTGYVFLGITLGLVAKSSGLAWWVPVVMSIVIFSGALEFAAIPILCATFDPVGAFILGVTISARHLFYGIPMLKKYDGMGKIKPFLIFGLTDETFSILSSDNLPCQESPKKFFFFVTLFDYLYWNIGTLLGSIIGSAVNVDLEGLDFVLTALFVVLFLEQLKTKTGLKSGLVGFGASVIALIIFGAAKFVLFAMAIMVLILIFGRRIIDHE